MGNIRVEGKKLIYQRKDDRWSGFFTFDSFSDDSLCSSDT